MDRLPESCDILGTGVGLVQQVRDAKAKIALMETLGINNAQFDDRTYFSRNRNTGVSILSTNGVIVKHEGCLTTVITNEPDSEPREVVRQVRATGYSQKLAGAMVTRSQSWVSTVERRTLYNAGA